MACEGIYAFFHSLLLLLLGNESSSPSSGSSRLSKPLVDPMEQLADKVDGEGCYVVTIFGLKTADCDKRNARSVPQSLDSDLQVAIQ